MSRSHNRAKDFGDGLGVFVGLRRKRHNIAALLLFYNIDYVDRIVHSKRGITIECYLVGKKKRFRFEHFEFWVAKNSREKLKEYFTKMKPGQFKRIRFGRLQGLVEASVYDFQSKKTK